MITGGFGWELDIASGRVRNWYIDREGAKRWVDNEELVRGIAGQHEPFNATPPDGAKGER